MGSSQFTVNSSQFKALRERISDISDQRSGSKEKRKAYTEGTENAEFAEKSEKKRRKIEAFDRKSPPLHTKGGAPSSSFGQWRESGNPKTQAKNRTWATRRGRKRKAKRGGNTEATELRAQRRQRGKE